MSRPDIQLDTLAGNFTGSAAANYPQLAIVAAAKYDWPIWVVAIQFSTSLTVFPSNPGAMLVTFGTSSHNAPLAVGKGLRSVICHLTDPNSIAGGSPLPVPSSKVSNITFGDCGYALASGEEIQLWASADTAAGNSLRAVTSIQYRRGG